MTSRVLDTTLALLLTFALIAPSAFFVAPQMAQAQYGPVATGGAVGGATATPVSPCVTMIPAAAAGLSAGIAAGLKALGFGVGGVGDPGNFISNVGQCLTSTMAMIEATITKAAVISGAAATQALVFDAYVLQPLAFILSGDILKLMTAGVIQFVIGKANGTGLPQFVADIQVSLQTVSDANTLAFFDQYIRSSRSPYAGNILAALEKDYLNKTSLLGFWERNMDTLRRTSPNINGYLNGNWMLGGVGSWFALTTQVQNNPFTMYPMMQNQLAGIIGSGVGGATGARLADISAGQGFVSWCGSTDDSDILGGVTTDTVSGSRAVAIDQTANAAYDAAFNAAIANGLEEEAVELAKAARQEAYDTAFAQASAANVGGAFGDPLGIAGDPCTNADGTTGTIKTPGSVIVATLNNILGGEQANVTRMGNVGPQINYIMKNIATVFKTINFGTQILGGPGSGGLLGSDDPGASGVSPLRARATSVNLGGSVTNVLQGAVNRSNSAVKALDRIAKYESFANAANAAADRTEAGLTSLINYCTEQQTIAARRLSGVALVNFITSNTAQITAAENTRVTIRRVFITTGEIEETRALAKDVLLRLQSGGDNAADLVADMERLDTMRPTIQDIGDAEKGVVTLGADSITVPGSAAGSGSETPPITIALNSTTYIDALGRIDANTAASRLICTVPLPPPPTASTTPPLP